MSYTVTVYFDDMIDETHFFQKMDSANVCKRQLENKYRGQRLYRVKLEEIADD